MANITDGCLFTTVKNTSGGALHFGFLPPHGRTLADEEEATIFGDLHAVVTNPRSQRALAKALDDGDLTIVTSPCPIVFDDGDQASYRLGSNNGSPVATAPDWDSFNGSYNP